MRLSSGDVWSEMMRYSFLNKVIFDVLTDDATAIVTSMD